MISFDMFLGYSWMCSLATAGWVPWLQLDGFLWLQLHCYCWMGSLATAGWVPLATAALLLLDGFLGWMGSLATAE